MDAPVDFTLDRARLLGNNLTSSSLGTYEGAYVDSAHASALSRSSGLTGSHASIQDLARVGTPSSMNTLGQYQSRFLHPSIAIQSAGASYAMMGNFLNGGSSSGEHLKSLMPAELQQYWTAHGEGCGTRYIINNNNIYSPYLSYLPATESLSLFAHNVGAGAAVQGQGQSAYHRIYDLHKEALYNVAPLGTSPSSFYGTIPPSRISPPSSRTSELLTQSEKGLNKKDLNNRYGDSKKSIDLSKSATKIQDDISKPSTKIHEDNIKSSTRIHEDVIKSSTAKNHEDFSKSSTKIHDESTKSSSKIHDEITRSSMKTNDEISKSSPKSHNDISKLSSKIHGDDVKKSAKAYEDLYKTSSKIHESHSNNSDTHVKKLKKHTKDKDNDKKDEHSESQTRMKHSARDSASKKEEQNKKQEKQEQLSNKKDSKDEEVEKVDKNSNFEQKEESPVKSVNGASSPHSKTNKTEKDSVHPREDNSKSEKSSSKADKSDDISSVSKSPKESVVACSESETKVQHIPTLTTVTLTPSESMTSVQSSKNLSSSAFKSSPTTEGSSSPPGSLTGVTSTMGIAQTSTTFSLPYYHSIYSHSQPPGAMDGKKVHAPTFTPEIGTLPSVASISSLPIQTTACDMRIKKETTSYSCCKERSGTSITSNNSHSPKYSHYSAKVTSPKSDYSDRKSFDNVKRGGNSEHKLKRSHLKTSELNEKRSAKLFESKDKALDCSKTMISPSAISVESKCKEISVRNNGVDSVVKLSCASPKEKSKLCSTSVKSPPLDTNSLSAFTVVNKSTSLGDFSNSRKRTSDILSTKEKLNSATIDRPLSNDAPLPDKTAESVRNITKESNVPISLLKNGGPLLAVCQDTKISNRKSDSRTSKHRSVHIDGNGCRKSKLPTLAPGKISDGRDKIGNHDEHSSTGGMNIPIGIAVAQKREELKKESTDVEDSVSGDTTNNSQVSESQQNGTTDGHQNGFGSAVVSKPSSPSDTLSEMRNQLPANLIVTGSATGTGVAWSEDPSARHFANPWVQTGSINPSAWMGQMSYTLPTNIPTSTTIDTNQLPVSIPHGYKLVQDSVTGQFMVIPSNIDLFDPSRMWSGFPSAATHPGAIQQILAAHHTQMQHHVLAQTPDRQPSAEFAIAVQHYQQQLQQMYQARQDAVIACQDLSQSGVNGSGGVNSQTSSTPSSGSLDHKEAISLQTGDVSGQQNDKEKTTVNLQQNIPDLTQESGSSLPEIVSIKTEMSSVQSRGTSPMVPASEIEDTSQETIEASSINSGSDSEHSNKHSNIASVQTCASDRCSSNESVSVEENSCASEKEKINTSCSEKIEHVNVCENSDTKSENKVKEQNSEKDIENSDTSELSLSNEARAASESAHILAGLSCSKVVTNSDVSSCDQNTKSIEHSSEKTYNPFLDPQILQAADGLELLSALAEKRAKCEDVTDFASCESNTSWGTNNNNSKSKENVCMFSDEEPPKSKRKQSISRTRSVPAIKPETKLESPSYYTSTGLRIPQGEEEINAIELDMRIRLAELQRQYKEKQREFARLTPKRDKDKEDYNSKRGPGRPRKRNHSGSSPKSETPVVKQGQVKTKEPPIKKKKQAEELVDRVFRKTGGGFGMPLSKKLKANAMAALYKTQSGFTMKRKGSTSSSSSMSPLSTPVKFSPIIKKEKLNIKTAINSDGKLKVLKKLTDKFTKKVPKESSEPEHRDKDDSIHGKITKVSKKSKEKSNDESVNATSVASPISKKLKEKDEKTAVDSNGLGLLAKYAVDVLDEHSTPVKKPIKRKVDEGVCNENTQTSSTENTVTTCTTMCTTATTTCTTTVPTNTKPKDSDAEASSDSTSPSNKKRKPGRPRKCIPNKTHGVTETIVAKNSKNFRLYQLQKFEDMWNAGVSQPKPKLEEKTPMKPLFLDEEWMLRRSERIFLSDPSPQSSPNFSYKDTLKPSPSLPSPQKPATSATKVKSEKAKLQKAKNIHDLTQRVKKKYSKAFKVKQQSKEKKEKKQVHHIPKKKLKKPISKEIISDSDSSSDGDNIPLSALRERPQTPVPRSCVIDQDELKDGLRVLLFKDGLFYEGAVLGIRPPDVYGVIIDNARGNRPLIYSQEEILKDAIIDVKASSARFLPEGTRVCAYWSQQFSCLYPGTVSKASPNPHADKNFINVEFDDGDSGRIPLDHIRMIPEDFPIVSYDPNPLLLIGKRRRHTTSDSIQSIQSLQSFTPEFHRSESVQPSSESKTKIKRGPGRPPKQKSENGLQNTESVNIDDEEDIDVCGLEEDNDEVFTSSVRSNKTGNDDSKSSKHSKDNSKKKQSNTSERKSGSEVKNKDKKVKNSQETGKSKKKERGKHKHSVGDTRDIFTFKRLPSLSDKLLSSLNKRKMLNTNKTEIEDNESGFTSTSDFSCNSSDDDEDSNNESTCDEGDQELPSAPKKQKSRSLSTDNKSKIAAFLPARQLWRWSGKSTKRPGLKGKAKKEFYKSIIRGKEIIALGDCAVFLSTGRPHLPFIGRIISLWEAWGGQMVVKVKWFYHPEETRGGKKLQDMKGALFQSPHIDENDVQTISHKCDVLSFTEYKKRHLEERRRGEHKTVDDNDIYYLAGTYEPTIGLLKFQDDIM